MGDKKVILSISVLISGQENMDKCLASLHYFRENLPCEIILVDTGCNREQRKLAEQCADKIIDFTWCDDFAAARNVGLKAVSGEWFLYLDDDEWFENPREIIEFFLSGEYRNYNSATYNVCNYLDRQGTRSEYVPVTRLVKLESETEFRGKIHEYLYPYKAPRKTFSDYVHHYGYAFQDEEEKLQHAKRNITLLEEMACEQPDELRWKIQLAQEYFVIDKFEETIVVCRDALDNWHSGKRISTNDYPSVGCLYGFILLASEASGKLDDGKEWLDKALQEPDMPAAARAFFYLLGMRIYSKLSMRQECRMCAKEYLDSYDKLRDDSEAVSRQTTLITETVFAQSNVISTMLLVLPTLIGTLDYALIRRAFYAIDWENSLITGQNFFEQQIVEACCDTEYHPLWVEMMQTLVSRTDGMREMYPVFLQTEIKYKKHGETDKLFHLRRLVSELKDSHRYILYTRILWENVNPSTATEEDRIHKLEELFQALFENYFRELLEIKSEVWDVAEKWNLDLEPLFLKIDITSWERELKVWILEASTADMKAWQARVSGWKHTEDARYKIFNVKCLEGYLRNSKPPFYGIQEVERLFWQCSDAILDLYRPCYTDSAFTDTPELLPDEIQFALQLRTLRQAREQGSDREVLEALRALNDTYEPMNGVIAYYAKLYREEVHNRNDEMAQLAAGLKRNVRILIGAGKLDDAKAVIIQLEQFIPGDEELQAFKDELQME